MENSSRGRGVVHTPSRELLVKVRELEAQGKIIVSIQPEWQHNGTPYNTIVYKEVLYEHDVRQTTARESMDGEA